MIMQAILSKTNSREIRRQIPPPPSEIHPNSLLNSLLSSQKLLIEQVFNRRLRILIATTLDLNIVAYTTPFVERANRLFSQLCGGAMCQPRFGFYESENCGLVKEMVFEVEAWTNDLGLKQAESAIEEFIVDILVQLGQETVFFAVDDRAFLLKLADG